MSITMAAARDRTPYAVGKWILTRILPADDLFTRLTWVNPNAADTHTYPRTTSELSESWGLPGQPVAGVSKIETEKVSSGLKQSTHKFNMPDFFRILMSGAGDQGQQQVESALVEIGKIVGKNVIAGQGIDTCTISAGSSLTAAHLGTIKPGPLYRDAGGPGTISFRAADNTLRYRAQGDSDYGEAVPMAVGTAVTLRSRRPSYWVKLTPAAIPGADAVCEVEYAGSGKPDGLLAQVDPGQVIAGTDLVNGDAFDFGMMDALVVKLGGLWAGGHRCAWIMHGTTEAQLLGKARQTAMSLDDIMLAEGDDLRKAKGYRGAPILRCDHMPGTPVANGKISYPLALVSLDPVRGFTGVCPGVPGEAAMMDGSMGFSGTVVEQNGRMNQFAGKPLMGYRVKSLGAARDFDGDETMVTWIGTTALQSVQAAAYRDNVR